MAEGLSLSLTNTRNNNYQRGQLFYVVCFNLALYLISVSGQKSNILLHLHHQHERTNYEDAIFFSITKVPQLTASSSSSQKENSGMMNPRSGKKAKPTKKLQSKAIGIR